MKKLGVFLVSLGIITGMSSLPAAAVQSPVGCNSNRLNLSITRDKITVKQGDTLTYTITASNMDSGASLACDIDTATVTVTLPAMDGTPTGQVVTLTTQGALPANTPITIIGTVPYVVNVTPGVTDASAEAEITGILHDAPTDHTAQISKTIGTTIVYDSDDPTLPSQNPSTPAALGLPGMPNTSSSK